MSCGLFVCLLQDERRFVYRKLKLISGENTELIFRWIDGAISIQNKELSTSKSQSGILDFIVQYNLQIILVFHKKMRINYLQEKIFLNYRHRHHL